MKKGSYEAQRLRKHLTNKEIVEFTYKLIDNTETPLYGTKKGTNKQYPIDQMELTHIRKNPVQNKLIRYVLKKKDEEVKASLKKLEEIISEYFDKAEISKIDWIIKNGKDKEIHKGTYTNYNSFEERR